MSFRPGQSGNPGGRPKTRGFPEKIRAATADGVELIDAVLGILRDPDSSRGERLKAAEWLGDRMLGKPGQHVELEATTTVEAPAIDFSRMPLADRIALEQLWSKALAAGEPGDQPANDDPVIQ